MAVDNKADFYWHPSSFPEGSYGVDLISGHPVAERHRPYGTVAVELPKMLGSRLSQVPELANIRSYHDLLGLPVEDVLNIYRRFRLMRSKPEKPMKGYLDRVALGAEEYLFQEVLGDAAHFKVPLTPVYDQRRQTVVKEVLATVPKSLSEGVVDLHFGISTGQPLSFEQLGAQFKMGGGGAAYHYHTEISALRRPERRNLLKPWSGFDRFCVGYELLGLTCMMEARELYWNLDWRSSRIGDLNLSQDVLDAVTITDNLYRDRLSPYSSLHEFIHATPNWLLEESERSAATRLELAEKFVALAPKHS